MKNLLLALMVAAAACSHDSQQASPLEHPDPAVLTLRAPDTVRVRFETSKGPFVIEAYRDWSPHGVDRFYQLAKLGYYNDARFFRVISGFMAQFGMNANPRVTQAWQDQVIADDPVTHPNKRGMVSFATRGPNTRSTQLFINFADNLNLDQMGFTPIGMISEGMNVVDSLYSGYGDGAPEGKGPDQDRIRSEGNTYLQKDFPQLDYIVKVTLLTPAPR